MSSMLVPPFHTAPSREYSSAWHLQQGLTEPSQSANSCAAVPPEKSSTLVRKTNTPKVHGSAVVLHLHMSTGSFKEVPSLCKGL